MALGAVDTLAAAHVVDCSPTTSAIDLSGRRDNGFFVRTIGSEALEAVALTKAMIATGRTAFVVLYPDDDYGLAFANQVQRSFRRLRESVKLVHYNPTAEHFNAPAEQALADEVGAIGVVGTGQTGANVLAALEQNGVNPLRTSVFVTDGLRRDDLGTMIDPAPARGLRRHPGRVADGGPGPLVLRGPFAVSSPGTPVGYAGYAYDCVNLMALAAVAAGSDDGDAIKAQLAAVSSGGSRARASRPAPASSAAAGTSTSRARRATSTCRTTATSNGLVRPVRVRRRRARRHAAGLLAQADTTATS